MVLSGNVVVMPSAIPLKKMVICLLAAISCEQAPGYGLCAYLPSSILGFCLAWTWAGYVCYHNLCELIFVSVLLHLGNAVLLQLFNHFCLLQSSAPFSTEVLESWELRDKGIPVRAEYSKVSHSLNTVWLWFCYLLSVARSFSRLGGGGACF